MHRFIALHERLLLLFHFIFVQDLLKHSYNELNCLHMTPEFCTVQTGFGAHPAPYSMGTKVPPPRRRSGRGVKLNTHVHIVPSIMNGTIPLLPPLAVVARIQGQLCPVHKTLRAYIHLHAGPISI